MFSLSLMCCRLQPVSSLLRSDSCWSDSSLECAFLRNLGLADTQHEVVLPILDASQTLIKGDGRVNYPLRAETGPAMPLRSAWITGVRIRRSSANGSTGKKLSQGWVGAVHAGASDGG